MPELRWILLGVGVAFFIGLWWWETRRRGRRAQASRRVDPLHSFEPADELERHLEEDFEEPAINRVESRAESRLEPTFDDAFHDGAPAHPQLEDDEPTFEPEPQPHADERTRPEPEPPASPAPKQEQKIISLRLVSAPDRLFAGRELREALQEAGLVHGKFSIFHRQNADGAPVFSVASLTEPGSFDLQTMDRQQFRGITFFAVLQEAGEEGAAQMRETAQTIADKLRGILSGGR